MTGTFPRTTLLGALLAAALVQAAPPKSKPFELRGNAERARDTYKNLCASCHGPKGAGDGPAARGLNPRPLPLNEPGHMATLTDEYLYNIVKDGGANHGKSPLMVSWKTTLTDQQIRDVAAFTRALAGPPPAAAATAPPAPAAKKK
jgi:cytochrome c553